MEIYKTLKQLGARGKNKAVTGRELSKILGISLRQVKKYVEIERRKHFICSQTDNGGGYFRPATISELLAFERNQTTLIERHALTLRLVRRFKKRMKREGNEE